MLKIALIYHSARNDNLGVGALTVSEVAILRSVAEKIGTRLRIILVDSGGQRPVYLHGDDIDIREVRELREFGRVLGIFREADLVIDIGGGDSFSDIYGWKRLSRMLLLKYGVLFSRRPLVLAPQTMGPFRKPLWKALARPTIRKAAVVATRDALSTRFLNEMGYDGPIVEASDVALRLPYDQPKPRTTGARPRVGLNVSGLLMNGGYTGSNMFGLKMDYANMIRSIIEGVLDHPDDFELHLVPHVISTNRGDVEDDYQASVDIARDYDGVTVAPAFASPSDAKSYIAGMDFFAGARMHACIAAFSTGVPVVPMAYSRKFAGLFGSLGYDRTVDCTAESAETIKSTFFDCLENRDQLGDEVDAALKHGLEKLGNYETALTRLMETAQSR